MATLSQERRSRAFLAVIVLIPVLYFLIYFSVLIVNNLAKSILAKEIASQEVMADELTLEAAKAVDQHDDDRAMARFNEAIEIYRQISRKLGHHFDQTINSATGPKYAGRLSSLDELNFERTWRVEKKLGDALSRRGDLFLKRNDFSNALADFDGAVHRASENPFAYEGRARSHRALGNNALADTDESTAKVLREMQAHKTERSK